MIKNIALFLCSLLAALLVAELILAKVLKAGMYERKIEVTVAEPKCYGNCYTSDPGGYFPIHTQAAAAQIYPDAAAGNATVPLYCIAYNCQARKDGFFKGRPKNIFLVGDSFTFGEGDKEEDTLGYTLGLNGHTYNIRNFGETAADLKRVSQIVENILSDPAHYNPAKIIYFYNLNDVIMSPAVAQAQKYIIDFENLRWSNAPQAVSPFEKFLSQTALYRLFKKVLVLNRETRLTINNYLNMYLGQDNAAQWRESVALLKAMNQSALSRGVELVVVIYPLLYKDPLGRYPFQPIHDLIMKSCRDNHISCIDGYKAFTEDRSLQSFTVHAVDFHPNGAANRRMAAYLKTVLDLN